MIYYHFQLPDKYISTYGLNVGQVKTFEGHRDIIGACIERTSINKYKVVVLYKKNQLLHTQAFSMRDAFNIIKNCYINTNI